VTGLPPVARRRILGAARRLGVEPGLRRVQELVSPWHVRRSRRDDAHLVAMMAVALRPDANCIDVGANAGDVLETMVRLAPQGRHIAYEPLPELASPLASRFPEVDVRTAALSDEPGEATFYRNLSADSRSGLKPSGECEPLTVRLEALDRSLPEDFAPDFIKVDVEGAELAVLRGGIETLRRYRPLVALEHGSTALGFGTTHRMVHDLLAGEAGLRIFDMDGNGPLSAAEFDRVADPPGKRWNFIACP
jgi:FkbM family methyltransferase